ncbi:hypothetical protein [Singulisphaera acidiphila]|uniref:DUF3160 domain-containing protein n=1 Tax=Singulisphaera acidiphila (strain ATCC BAA-1392 / DSM 18658 / VKM B-2454 / MOB10) TaxID=886293 RepID=L0DFD1_SINAD|nr:hypothetical protein [Singulisphaera acidiphila]AGA27523.1 hypothetical protein Sinac_3252 [Singulisphaera acidiphila DSM 18658]
MLLTFRSCFATGACALAAALAGPTALGADPQIKVLSISPSPAPIPALRHRLLLLESERTPGDAAPIYLRLTGEVPAENLRDLREKPLAWLALPLDLFPTAQARKFVDEWRPKLLQIEYGARRETCEWNYTLPEERERVIEIGLPEIQTMRTWVRLVALKARVEIAEHHNEEAARTIETGLSFSRHVGNGPFLINAMVGVASAQVMLDQVDELLSQPDAPNLYWSLTALPHPLVGMRKALANEYKMCEWILPEMTDLGQARTGAEWASRLAKFQGRIHKLAAVYNYNPVKITTQTGKPANIREWVLPEEAREYVKARNNKTDGLNDDQIILMFFAGKYHELYDNVYKSSYLPFPEAERFYHQGAEELNAVKKGPLGLLAHLIASVEDGHRAEAVLDRKVAALRVVEALRLHAAVGGRLPNSLGDVKVVPIPTDPVSGKPFDYRLTGDSATLASPMPKGQEQFGLSYRITLRK